MATFLAKTHPETYSLADLKRDGETVWDGVTNPQAVKTILAMRPGDHVLVYHSGDQSAIVGLAKVTGAGRPDPNDPKSAVADFQFAGTIDPPVTLRDIKAMPQFQDWALVRQGRLSTMPVPEAFVGWLRANRPQCGL